MGLFLAASSALAGCLGGAEPPAQQPQPAGFPGTLPAGSDPGATSNDSITPATAWVRDYWGEKTEVTLVEDSGTVRNLFQFPTGGCISCFGAFFAPGEGQFVAPGSEAVEVTATWTPPPTAPGLTMTLFHRTAADGDVQEAELRSGEPLRIPVRAEDADAPLAPGSQWWFFLMPDLGAAGSAFPEVEVQFKAVAKRGPALPEFAEPPDPWGAATRLALLQGETAQEQLALLGPLGWFCLQCRNGWEPPGPALVPAGSARLEATLSWDWAGPTKPMLHYWNAKVQGGPALAIAQDGDRQRSFALDVPPDQVDSPYQRRTTWGFFVSFDSQGQDAGAALGTMTLDVAVAR